MLKAIAARFLPHTPAPEAVAGLVAILVGSGLLVVKFVAYFVTGSAAIFSDAMESIVNVLASGFAVYALAYAHRPADKSHPYGHGKIEFMSAGFEGAMILLAAAVIAFRAVEAMIRRPALEQMALGIVLMAAAMVVNGLLGWYLIRSGRKAGSITLEADGKHLMTDAVTSAAALVALAIVKISGWRIVDPLAAAIMAVYLAFTGWHLLRRSTAGLMDEQDEADQRLLEGILNSHMNGKEPKICSWHKLRHRHSGRYHWVDFHIMVPRELSVEEGHTIASAIEYEIEKALGEGKATAHVEPARD